MTEHKKPNEIYCTYSASIRTTYLLPIPINSASVQLAFSFPSLNSLVGRTVTIEISIERLRYIRWLFDVRRDWRPICLRVAHFISLVCHTGYHIRFWRDRIVLYVYMMWWSITADLRLSSSLRLYKIADKGEEGVRTSLTDWCFTRNHSSEYFLHFFANCLLYSIFQNFRRSF